MNIERKSVPDLPLYTMQRKILLFTCFLFVRLFVCFYEKLQRQLKWALISDSKGSDKACFWAWSVKRGGILILLLESAYSKGLKAALLGLRQFLTTENPLKIMKNVFCFTLKALSFLRIFEFSSWLFWSCRKTPW